MEVDRDAMRRSGEEHNPGAGHRPAPGGVGDRAARRRRRLWRCCWSSATRARASWAGRGSSPAARSTPARARATTPHRAAAVRELAEEAGVELDDPQALVKFSRWITPDEVQIRFDTHFFLAPARPTAQAPAATARSASTRLVRARSRAGRPRCRRDPARLPHHQAPRAARALRQRRRADRPRAGAARCKPSSRGCWCRARPRASCCRASPATKTDSIARPRAAGICGA